MACGTPPPRPDRGPGVRGLATRSGFLDLTRPAVVGILNATPDSFSDGGLYLDPARAAETAVAMVEGGARMLDLGAESTRPGSVGIEAGEELARLLPVLRAVRRAVAVPLSIDTRKAAVAEAALGSGADVVNDVSAGRDDEALLPLCARAGVPVVLMHMRGRPATMQEAPRYDDVVGEVAEFLARRAQTAREAGIGGEQIIVDPGIGFGKSAADNMRLLGALDVLVGLGYPVLVGVSRKGFIGEVLGGGRPPGERVFGTAAAVALAVAHGAHLLRVHDVRAMAEVVAVAEAITRA